MRKSCFLFSLMLLCCLLPWRNTQSQENTLRVLEGTFLETKSNVLFMETEPGIHVRIPFDKKTKIVSGRGAFSFAWLLPGDGIRVVLDHDGRGKEIEVFLSFTFGTVAFTSPDRLTLLEGPQFFAAGAPVYLNGRKIANLLELKPPNEVLVRFDSLGRKTVGIWAFDRSEGFKENSNPLQNTSWIATSLEKNQLRIRVKTKPLGKLFVQLLGATQKIRLVENQPGHYQTTLFIPSRVNLPQSFLQFEWLGFMDGETADSEWIFPKPVSFYTQGPSVTDLGPANGSTAPINPPFIFASFDPTRAPLDLGTVRLLVDRKNVTAECYVDQNLVFFSPQTLPPGKHTCFLSGRTLGGRGAFQLKWSFHVHS